MKYPLQNSNPNFKVCPFSVIPAFASSVWKLSPERKNGRKEESYSEIKADPDEVVARKGSFQSGCFGVNGDELLCSAACTPDGRNRLSSRGPRIYGCGAGSSEARDRTRRHLVPGRRRWRSVTRRVTRRSRWRMYAV